MDKEINQIIATLMINELRPRLKKNGLWFESCPVTPEEVGAMARLKKAGFLSTHQIRGILDRKFEQAQSVCGST